MTGWGLRLPLTSHLAAASLLFCSQGSARTESWYLPVIQRGKGTLPGSRLQMLSGEPSACHRTMFLFNCLLPMNLGPILTADVITVVWVPAPTQCHVMDVWMRGTVVLALFCNGRVLLLACVPISKPQQENIFIILTSELHLSSLPSVNDLNSHSLL